MVEPFVVVLIFIIMFILGVAVAVLASCNEKEEKIDEKI